MTTIAATSNTQGHAGVDDEAAGASDVEPVGLATAVGADEDVDGAAAIGVEVEVGDSVGGDVVLGGRVDVVGVSLGVGARDRLRLGDSVVDGSSVGASVVRDAIGVRGGRDGGENDLDGESDGVNDLDGSAGGENDLEEFGRFEPPAQDEARMIATATANPLVWTFLPRRWKPIQFTSSDGVWDPSMLSAS